MKTKTLIIFLLFISSIVGAIFSASSSFAYSVPDQKPDDCTGSNGEVGPGCGGGGDIYILGCTDKNAINYNKYANVAINKSCIYKVLGCTNPEDPNYNPLATEDDGSCKNGGTDGNKIYFYCATTGADNYQTPSECRKSNNARPQDSCIIKNEVCKNQQLTGCTDKEAGNYNPKATIEDGSCLYSGKNGCTDTKALNYDSTATIDDGSCEYTVAENTLCLQQINGTAIEFRTIPNFSNMATFNNLYTLCSNGGVFTKTTLALQGTSGSFSGYCENSSSIDNNQTRCTYPIIDDVEVFLPPPFYVTGIVTGVNNIPLSGIQVNITMPSGDIQSTITDGNGAYIFNGLGIGEYSLRPNNSMPYLFPNSESVNLQNSSATVNFSGIDTTVIVQKNDFATLLNRDATDLDDWLKDLSDKWNDIGGNTPNALDIATLSNAQGNGNIFSNNSLASLFNNGYLPLSNSYTPVPLSLIPKYADNNSICGDGLRQTGETCDDGVNNGRGGYCSSDCLYIGEIRFTSQDDSNSTNDNTSSGLESSTLAISERISSGMKILQLSISKAGDSISKAGDSIENSQNFLKQKLVENLSPETIELLKDVTEVTKEVAKYSVIAIASVLGVGAVSLNIMAYKAHWVSYTVKAGDTLDSIGNQFTMTERAMRAKNSSLAKGELRPGTKIKVRNRHFIEKDYLDQLKFVLKDSLEKRNYGKMSSKIDKLFAKK